MDIPNYSPLPFDPKVLIVDDIYDVGLTLELIERYCLARGARSVNSAVLVRKIHDRARRVIFLNPEPRNAWNSGDSVMRVYEPCVDRAIVCASLKDLERVVSDLLRTAV